MDSPYPPENACFAAISHADTPPNFEYGWLSLSDISTLHWNPLITRADRGNKRARATPVEPGTIIYVRHQTAEPSDATFDGFFKCSKVKIMPVGIAIDGIPQPFVSASIQVSGMASCRTQGAKFLNVADCLTVDGDYKKRYAEARASSSAAVKEAAFDYVGRIAPQLAKQHVYIPGIGDVHPAEGTVRRTRDNSERSWTRVCMTANDRKLAWVLVDGEKSPLAAP